MLPEIYFVLRKFSDLLIVAALNSSAKPTVKHCRITLCWYGISFDAGTKAP
jgi:hypothetical protein